jgi:hypothetical protein
MCTPPVLAHLPMGSRRPGECGKSPGRDRAYQSLVHSGSGFLSCTGVNFVTQTESVNGMKYSGASSRPHTEASNSHASEQLHNRRHTAIEYNYICSLRAVLADLRQRCCDPERPGTARSRTYLAKRESGALYTPQQGTARRPPRRVPRGPTRRYRKRAARKATPRRRRVRG